MSGKHFCEASAAGIKKRKKVTPAPTYGGRYCWHPMVYTADGVTVCHFCGRRVRTKLTKDK